MASKTPKARSGLGRCNQPSSHQNSPKAPPTKKSSRTPGKSRYERSGGGEEWRYSLWNYRRALKIAPTSQPQDLIRCYEAMTPRMYKKNLEAKEQMGNQYCCPLHRLRTIVLPVGYVNPLTITLNMRKRETDDECSSYENLLLPKTVEKKKARGSHSVGRYRTSVTGTRNLKKRETIVLGGVLGQPCKAIHDETSNHERDMEGHSQALISTQARKPKKHVRFDDDSEWIDLSDDDSVNGAGREEDKSVSVIEEDEYILL
jgi:hypothetical protein